MNSCVLSADKYCACKCSGGEQSAWSRFVSTVRLEGRSEESTAGGKLLGFINQSG